MRGFILMLLVAPLAAGAEIYRYVEDGEVVYSDEPRPGAEEVEVGSPSIYEAPAQHGLEETAEAEDDAADAADPYTSFVIEEPRDEATVWETNGNVAVSLALDPGLQPEDRIVVALDGEPLDQDLGGATRFQLSGVERGAHTLRAWIEGPDEDERIATESVTFHMKTHQVPRSERDPATGRQPYQPPSSAPRPPGGD